MCGAGVTFDSLRSRLQGAACRMRGTSLTRKRSPLGPYRRPMSRVPGCSRGVGIFLLARHPCRVYRSLFADCGLGWRVKGVVFEVKACDSGSTIQVLGTRVWG